MELKEYGIIDKYTALNKRMLGYYFPNVGTGDLDLAINYSINKRYKEESCIIDNDYKHKQVNMNLLELTEYIYSREPIITNYGVMFKKHGTVPNPLMKMIAGFINDRKKLKKIMFKYPKGSDEFEKYNLLQLLEKLNANGSYGALGMYSCLFYNLNVASSTTAQGRKYISIATMLFESFLSNGVKFGSLNEIITYFDNIINEEHKFNTKDFIDKDISVEDCFTHIILTCGFNWIPNNEEMDTIWVLLNRFSQDDINRIYYKNNLYEFMENSSMVKCIKLLLKSLDMPFMDPNDPPVEIQAQLDAFLDILMEFVYYHHQVIDSIDRCDNMIKNVCCISDTDSAIVSLDAWYRFVLDKVVDDDMKIKKVYTDVINLIDKKKPKEVTSWVELDYDYDFFNDDIIQIKKSLDVCKIIPEEGLRFSIINIMGYILTKLSDDILLRYSKINNSYSPDKPCLMSLKNEFLFSRSLLTNAKKNYATKQILQEGNLIPEDQSLDIKGLAINKPPLTKEMRSELKKIVYEDILNCPVIDQVKVIKKLAILEKKIFQSLQKGEKKYFKSVSIKSMNTYDDPMRIQGIKASIVWNMIRDDGSEAIDLESRNAIDIVKVNINTTNVEIIKDDYPETYNKILYALSDDSFKGNITAVAIPKDCQVPPWLTFFIDYTTIINDNLTSFPLESIGVCKMNNNNINYSNIIQI